LPRGGTLLRFEPGDQPRGCRPVRRAADAAEGFSIQIFGNTHGLKANQVRLLERLSRRRVSPDRLVSHELAREMAGLSREIARQIGVLVDRRGAISHVMVGDARSIEMPDWGRMRAGQGRLRGLRCIHTHLVGEGLTRDDLTDLVLLRFDAMVTVAADEDGSPGKAHVAALRATYDQEEPIQYIAPQPPAQLDFDFREWIRALEEELAGQDQGRAVVAGERAILVSVTAGERDIDPAMQVDELVELARSAGVEVVANLSQSRRRPDPKSPKRFTSPRAVMSGESSGTVPDPSPHL
jgi:GTP-binding protein HflX